MFSYIGSMFHMRVCRKLYGFDHLHPVSDDVIQSHIRILPPAYHLRRSRLLYLGRLFIHGPPELLGIITASLHSYLFDNYTYSWLASLHQDIVWISARCPQFEPFKDLTLLEILHSMGFRMLLSSSSWSKHVKVVFENIFDDWKHSPELHPNKFSFPLPPPVLPVGPLAVPPSPPSPSPPLCHYIISMSSV